MTIDFEKVKYISTKLEIENINQFFIFRKQKSKNKIYIPFSLLQAKILRISQFIYDFPTIISTID